MKKSGGTASKIFSKSVSSVNNLVGYYDGYVYYQNSKKVLYKYKSGKTKKVASMKYLLQVSTGKYAGAQLGNIVAPGNFIIYKMTTGKKVKTLKTKSYQRGASTGKFYICSQVYKNKKEGTVTRIRSCTSTGKSLKIIAEVPIKYTHNALMGHTGTFFTNGDYIYKLTYSTKKLTKYAKFLKE